jgi:hypothetical protein
VTECASARPTFILQINDSGVVYKGVPLDGTFGNYDDGDGPMVGFNGDPESDALILSLSETGELEIVFLGAVAFTQSPPGLAKHILFSPPPLTFGVPVTCSVVGGALSCQNDGCDVSHIDPCDSGVNILQICPAAAITNDLWIGAIVGNGCFRATFNVIPVCIPKP